MDNNIVKDVLDMLQEGQEYIITRKPVEDPFKGLLEFINDGGIAEVAIESKNNEIQVLDDKPLQNGNSCNVCNKTFDSTAKLGAHKKQDHTDMERTTDKESNWGSKEVANNDKTEGRKNVKDNAGWIFGPVIGRQLIREKLDKENEKNGK